MRFDLAVLMFSLAGLLPQPNTMRLGQPAAPVGITIGLLLGCGLVGRKRARAVRRTRGRRSA